MTPMSGMPAFRIYTANSKTFGIMDVETYYADMSNLAFQAGPTWTKYYSAREAYGPVVLPPLNSSSELSPAFWHNVTSFWENNSTSFEEYWTRRTRGWNVQPCNDDCRKLEICQLRAARSENNCVVPTLGAGIGIRSLDEHTFKIDTSKCDNSLAATILQYAASRVDLLEHLGTRLNSKRSHPDE